MECLKYLFFIISFFNECVCNIVTMFVFLCVCSFVCFFVSFFFFFFVSLFISFFVWLFVCLFLCFFVCLVGWLFGCLVVCLFVWFVCLFVCLFFLFNSSQLTKNKKPNNYLTSLLHFKNHISKQNILIFLPPSFLSVLKDRLSVVDESP